MAPKLKSAVTKSARKTGKRSSAKKTSRKKSTKVVPRSIVEEGMAPIKHLADLSDEELFNVHQLITAEVLSRAEAYVNEEDRVPVSHGPPKPIIVNVWKIPNVTQ